MQLKAMITSKGRALLAAIDAGLIQEVEGGWDDEAFNRFWEAFTRNLDKVSMKEMGKICNDLRPVVDNKPANSSGYCPKCHHIKSIFRSLRFLFYLISFLFGAFFTHVTLMLI